MGAYQISVPGHNSEEVNHLRRLLQNKLQHWDPVGQYIRLEEKWVGDRTVFRLSHLRMGKQPEKNLRLCLGTAVAEYILAVDEPELIRGIISREFHPKHREEIDQVAEYTFHLLHETETDEGDRSFDQRKEKMVRTVVRYLSQHRNLAVDGFVRFRLKKYHRVLVNLVEHAIDEYLLDQEYQEFIDLLKYFVLVQKSKVPMVHVIHTGKRKFQVLEADGRPLRLKEMDGVVQEMMDHSYSQEDLIVSTLLTVAPERIILHTRHDKENVIRTLMQIFEGRVVVCHGCPECRSRSHSQ
jgi:putative sporulation protein YtxC